MSKTWNFLADLLPRPWWEPDAPFWNPDCPYWKQGPNADAPFIVRLAHRTEFTLAVSIFKWNLLALLVGEWWGQRPWGPRFRRAFRVYWPAEAALVIKEQAAVSGGLLSPMSNVADTTPLTLSALPFAPDIDLSNQRLN